MGSDIARKQTTPVSHAMYTTVLVHNVLITMDGWIRFWFYALRRSDNRKHERALRWRGVFPPTDCTLYGWL